MQTILVVDDQSELRHAVRGMLEARGFGVLEAADGERAVESLRQQPIDAALVDVDMPGMNGIEVCHALRLVAAELARPFRVSLMTGVLRPELDDKARAVGACGVLPKPFTMAELVRHLRGMLSPEEPASPPGAA